MDPKKSSQSSVKSRTCCRASRWSTTDPNQNQPCWGLTPGPDVWSSIAREKVLKIQLSPEEASLSNIQCGHSVGFSEVLSPFFLHRIIPSLNPCRNSASSTRSESSEPHPACCEHSQGCGIHNFPGQQAVRGHHTQGQDQGVTL